ncbi:MAG TPA: hypothetical protein VF587_14160 [Solirubrobacteraceae bacterium]
MALHRKNERGELFDAGGLPKLKVKRGADGRLEVQDPDPKPVHEETRPDEKPPQPPDPRGPVNPNHAGF